MAKTPKAPKLVDPEGEALRQRLQGLTIRGENAEKIVGDLTTAKMLMGLMGVKNYEGVEEVYKELVPLAMRRLKNSVDSKEEIGWANVLLKVTHQNGMNVEKIIGLAGLSKAPENTVNVQINNTAVDKVINIIDSVRGGHGRNEETQEVLNDAARRLLFGETPRPVSVEETRVGPSLGASQDSGGRQVLDAPAPRLLERNSGADDGEEEPPADPELASSRR